MDQARGSTVCRSRPTAAGCSPKQAGGASELVGVAIALVVLVLTFGSLVAAGLPLLTAFVGVGIGMLSISAMTAFTDISSSTTGLATMIGLAVGIDYALFILARYRSELEVLGERAARRSGRACRRHRRLRRHLRRADRDHRARRAGRRPHPVPDRDGTRSRGHRAGRRTGGPHPAAGPARAVQVQGVRRSGTPLRSAPRRRRRILNNGVRWARLVGRAPVDHPARGGGGARRTGAARHGPSPGAAERQHRRLPTPPPARRRTWSPSSFGAGRQAPLLVVVDGRDVAGGATGGGGVRPGRSLGRRPGRRGQRPGRRP